jgi:hypothetical protein
MKQIVPFAVAALLLGSAGCKVEKTGKDSYKVVTPDTAAKAEEVKTNARETGQQVKQEAKEIGAQIKKEAHDVAQSEAGQQIKKNAKDLGQSIKKGAGDVAQAAGSKLQEKGSEMSREAQQKQEQQKTDTRKQ